VSLFMAVPTIYVKLIAEWEGVPASEKATLSRGAGGLRLMVSGSAALPTHAFERWLEITGHELLERYGMTEIGMAISNPLDGERRPGYVGVPLPGVNVRLVDEEGEPITEEGEPGRIQVRGPGLFLEYWKRLEETRASYQDAWFDTGDEATVEDGYYRILGRTSVDIIKTGGYKVSALEIENVLRGHPAISDCAVVGVQDPEWGERVCVAVVPEPPDEREPGELLEELKAWAAERLASYKVPRDLRKVVELPRNAMGKVTKPEVQQMFVSDGRVDADD
jgi:malonyl-CoA/methylmalonyl-CoA synthetase